MKTLQLIFPGAARIICNPCTSLTGRDFKVSYPLWKSHSTSANLLAKTWITRQWAMSFHNRKSPPHRNDTSGNALLYYNKGKWLDYGNQKIQADPLDDYRSTESTKLLDYPEDDVYLSYRHKAKQNSLVEAIDMLKSFSVLDLTDQTSFVMLKCNLTPFALGKGKRKKNMIFHSHTVLPYPADYKNKVCVFTPDESLQKQALENGAFAAGDKEVAIDILKGVLKCDVYMCTQDYYAELQTNLDLKRTLGSLFPHAKRMVYENCLPVLEKFANNTIYHNLFHEGCESKIIVGRICQPTEHLEANIRHMLEVFATVHPKAPDDYVSKAAISCFTDYIDFIVPREDL